MAKTILVKRSNDVDAFGNPIPPSDLQYGEIAINYAGKKECLFIKNSDGKIVNIFERADSSWIEI